MALIKRTVTGAALITILALLFFFAPPTLFSALLAATALYIIIVEWPRLGTKSISWFCAGMLYIGVPFLCLLLLNHSPAQRVLIPVLFLVVFAHDAGAYIIGSLFGKHIIAPTISPKKTWQGLSGGFCATLLALIFIYSYAKKAITINSVMLAALCTIVATAGDFFESWLKRRAGVKDSGTLLPGHGGLLDRFDSLLPMAVLVYLLRDYFFANSI